MTLGQQEKIKRFLEDKTMASAVKEVLRETFLRPRTKMDVQTLAAERLAINLLADGWKELEKCQSVATKPEAPAGNQGM